ncbi:MAG: methyltransferase domain-containing protein [Solirubrobacterales bacterium]|nr:methyltransferase domain-containing protein [Solirubrobacterales bacterium]
MCGRSHRAALITDDEIAARFDSLPLEGEERIYLATHAPRYRYLLDRVDAVRRELGFPQEGRGLRLLDIGPSFQTQLLRDRYPDAEVATLGLEPSAVSSARPGERHVEFDLNDAADAEAWPRLDAFPLIVFAEVIEHLYTAPAKVLVCAASWLAAEGVILVQTPNAVAAHRRAMMLAGRNPYHRIRENRKNPGHFREYTRAELEQEASAAGLVTTEA